MLQKYFRYASTVLNRTFIKCNLTVHGYATLPKRRVVVTGMGALSPLGCGIQHNWVKLLNGENGIIRLGEAYDKLPCRIAALVPRGTNPGCLNLKDHFTDSELRTMSTGMAYCLIATKEALSDASWFPDKEEEKERTGVAVGMAMQDLEDIANTDLALKKSYNRVSPYFIPRILSNLAGGHISIKYGFQGPNHCVSTACATGCHAIGDAFHMIQRDDADVMVCGATEACIGVLSVAAFCRVRALATNFNDNPSKASKPFDKDREGFVMGEGAGILVLEELEHAIQRNAPKIYAEILGYGLSGDAHHITSARADGKGAINAIKGALKHTFIDPHQITYVNAHATSTPLGDKIEVKAIKQLFHPDIHVSSNKGAIGHLLGAAGSVETAFTVMACSTGILPPSINIDEVDETMKMNFVTSAIPWKTDGKRIAIKNSFGFGGTNAALCISSFSE